MPLAELNRVIEAERQALLEGDWVALDRCSAEKLLLTETLGQRGLSPSDKQSLTDIRRAALHNARLAGGLGRQLGRLLGKHREGSTYTRNARVSIRPWTMLSKTG